MYAYAPAWQPATQPVHRNNYQQPRQPQLDVTPQAPRRANSFVPQAVGRPEAPATHHDGCGGATETKYHHIGACLEPRMMAIRGAFAAKYGIEMTGGVFLPQQVIQIMAHDSATWRVELNNTETEEAVQAYLDALHKCWSNW